MTRHTDSTPIKGNRYYCYIKEINLRRPFTIVLIVLFELVDHFFIVATFVTIFQFRGGISLFDLEKNPQSRLNVHSLFSYLALFYIPGQILVLSILLYDRLSLSLLIIRSLKILGFILFILGIISVWTVPKRFLPPVPVNVHTIHGYCTVAVYLLYCVLAFVGTVSAWALRDRSQGSWIRESLRNANRGYFPNYVYNLASIYTLTGFFTGIVTHIYLVKEENEYQLYTDKVDEGEKYWIRTRIVLSMTKVILATTLYFDRHRNRTHHELIPYSQFRRQFDKTCNKLENYPT